MAARRLPWAGETVEAMEGEIYAGIFDVPACVPTRLGVAIRNMLVVDPRRRWTQRELVHFDYFEDTRPPGRRQIGSRPAIVVKMGPYPSLPVSTSRGSARFKLSMVSGRSPTFQHSDDIFIDDG
jgi:hypothetical protein